MWFDEMPDPSPQRFVADPAIPRAFPTVIHGQGGSAKSLQQVLDFAVRYVSMGEDGGTWLGNRVPRGGKVLVVDFELNAAVFSSRVKKLAKGMGLDPSAVRGLGYYELGDVPPAIALTAARELCEEHGFDVVVVDSVGPALEGDAGSAKDVIGFHRTYISSFTAMGVTPFLIDH